MATEKDLSLVGYILKLTQEGKLKWEATARPNEFTASLKGKYNVVIERVGFSRGVRFENDPDYSFKLIDNSEQELLQLTESDYIHTPLLFDLARRSVLNVDAVIDDILSDDKDKLPF
jgi:hypothetical protein